MFSICTSSHQPSFTRSMYCLVYCSTYLFICLSISTVYLFICSSIHLLFYLSVYLSFSFHSVLVFLSVYPSFYYVFVISWCIYFFIQSYFLSCFSFCYNLSVVKLFYQLFCLSCSGSVSLLVYLNILVNKSGVFLHKYVYRYQWMHGP